MSNARDKANIPSLNFSSTGIDDNATSNAITIDSLENVGIGTTSPNEKLEVVNGAIQIRSSAASGYPNLKFLNASKRYDVQIDGSTQGFRIVDGTSSTERMRIDSSGNVGIGTSSPVSDAKLTISSDNTESYIFFERSGSGRIDTAIGNNTGRIVFKGGSDSSTVGGLSEYMTIDGSGRVGIGTTSPDPFIFHAKQGSGMGSYPTWESPAGRNIALFENSESESQVIIGSPTNGYGLLGFADPNFKYSGSVAYNHATNYMRFATNGSSEKMRIDSSGNVGINTTNTDTKFSLESPAKISRSATSILDSSNLTNKFELLKFTIPYGFQPPAMITGTLMVSVVNSKSSFNGKFGFRSTHIDFTFCSGIGFASNGFEVLQAINTLSNSAVNATHSAGRLTALTVTAEVSYDGGSTFGTSFGVAQSSSTPTPIVRLVANTTRSNTDADRLGLNYTGTYSYNDLSGGSSPVLSSDAITDVT